jgi:hypothetical protein
MGIVHSQRFVGPLNLPIGTITDLYEVPPGKTAIIRGLIITNNHATTVANWRLLLDPAGAQAGTVLYIGQPLAGVSSAVLPVDLVLNAGDELRGLASAGGAGQVFVTVFGWLLDGEPEA